MKLCVFSDSHGYADNMIEAVRRERPALCFFLGDGEHDLVTLRNRCPALPIHAVRGNCDPFSTQPLVLNCVVGGLRFFVTHGHQHGVKYDNEYRDLCYAALRANADVALFGHTHIPFLDRHLGMTILNPGQIGRAKNPSYGLLNIDNGQLFAEIKAL